MQALTNRLEKRFSHLKKWAHRVGVTCFRVYQKDIPEFPLIVDWYDGDVVAWAPSDFGDVSETIRAALGVSADHLFLKKRYARKDGEQYEKLEEKKITKIVAENGLKFEINLSDYLDVGLFLDHRHHRQSVREMAKGKRVLNLFAYTGAFSVYALSGGAAEVTTVDLSKVYCDWTRRNFALNAFSEGPKNRIFDEDTFEFLKFAAKKNLHFDIIICDPPTFSRSKKMKNWFSIDEDYAKLIAACEAVLARNGLLIFSTNSRKFKLDSAKLPKNLTVGEKTPQHDSEDFRSSIPHRCWHLAKDAAATPPTSGS